MTNRTYQGTAVTLAYDPLDQLVKWSDGTGNSELYAYDATGNRTLRRSTSSGTTTITVYAFSLEEHLYSGTGSSQGHTYYYTLGGRLIGERTTSPAATNIFLTDALGSVLLTFSNAVGSAAVLGSQVYGPYGTQRYASGSMGTSKGFTGQYNDTLTGLDYYNARYYDPVVGVFLSADTVQGNLQGLNPYNYVGGNPETRNDPTGRYVPCPDDGCGSGGGGSSSGGGSSGGGGVPFTGGGRRLCVLNGGCGQTHQQLDRTALLLLCALNPACKKWEAQQSFATFLNATLVFIFGVATLVVAGIELAAMGGEMLALYGLAGHADEEEGLVGDIAPSTTEMATAYQQEEEALTKQLEEDGITIGACSFTPQTVVATQHGEHPIGTLHVGDKVWAYNPKTRKMELQLCNSFSFSQTLSTYNPKTRKMELQPILHVWIHSDHDLVDLTLTTSTTIHHGSLVTIKQQREVIHTNQQHPFLTGERGFLPVRAITLGMHIVQADGHVGLVAGWNVVAGARMMYNLEVAQDHTFTVGEGQWVVHNDCGKIYSANGDAALRATRRPAFDDMMNNGVEVDGQTYKLNQHAYNTLFKSGRKDIMPADIIDAWATEDPLPANPGSVKYINPVTGTTVFVNPTTNEIVGIWPSNFV